MAAGAGGLAFGDFGDFGWHGFGGGGYGLVLDHFPHVYNAVAAGASKAELLRVIDECAQGDEQRRAQAVNHAETPLKAAHRQKRGVLVGALVEAGADVRGIFGGKLTPLAVCIAYGQVDSVRALLRAGHDANETIEWVPERSSSLGMDGPRSCAPVHLCLAPPPLDLPSDRKLYVFAAPNFDEKFGVPQIGCLEVLLREGGADANALDWFRQSPIFWLARYGSKCDQAEQEAARDLLVAAGARTSGVFDNSCMSPLMWAVAHHNTLMARYLIKEAGAPVNERGPVDGSTALHHCFNATTGDDSEMVSLLLDAGADVEPRDTSGETPLFHFVHIYSMAATRLLLDQGASVNVIACQGWTILGAACTGERGDWLRDETWPLFEEILRRSSAETRRSRFIHWAEPTGTEERSAVDLLALRLQWSPDQNVPPEEELRVQKRCRWAIGELLASGAPLQPENAAALLPLVVSLSARQRAELAARHAELRSWRAHETFVGLSFDVKELREAQRALLQRRARLAALELELFELGVGTTDSGSDSGSDESDDEDEEASSSAGDEGAEDESESKSESSESESESKSES